MPITRTDVGCWIIKCNPVTGTDYFGTLDQKPSTGVSSSVPHADSWCLSARSGRRSLVREGDLLALWVTGPKYPGIYEYGWVTGVRPEEPIADSELVGGTGTPPDKLHYEAIRLGRNGHIARSLMQATPELAACEQLRAPMMSNPSYFTNAEVRGLARLIAARQPAEHLRAARWDTLL
ncbi:hypothetical protein [Williamsia sp. 1135]|uniref:hypothetical protein n=1 Tax=Williamsia sp. 1135 TaxID=1889262 RepID=UPI000A25A907|nr:hypothetical protein [Williamsia sp. 1135]ORM35677.1 hypothetical protein BFL43_08870 [Williamsia sp. 1135]